jgi:phytoene dehydrogenase-like protein
MSHFDVIIIGTGQAGPSLAARFAAAGRLVAIIERHKLGGTSANTANKDARCQRIHPTVAEYLPTVLSELGLLL